MSSWLTDLRYAAKSLCQQPIFAVMVILTLAVGIGANTMIFTWLSALYWEKIPIVDPGRVFLLHTGDQERPRASSSYLDYLEYEKALDGLADLHGWSIFSNVVGLPGPSPDSPNRNVSVFGEAVTPGFFQLFDAQFKLGRAFLEDEHRGGADRVVVVDHLFWTRYLESDPAALGRDIDINGHAFTIVGIAPRDFQGHGIAFRFFVPMAQADLLGTRPMLENRKRRLVSSAIRLHDGVSREQVEARLITFAGQLDQEYPWPEGKERRLSLSQIGAPDGDPHPGEKMMAGAVVLLLFLACANVANLCLARASRRRREIAVRSALGAGRWGLVRPILIEGGVLSILGGGAGVALAYLLIQPFREFLQLTPVGLGGWGEGTPFMSLDNRVLLFTLGVAIATAVLFSLAPVLYVWRTDLIQALKGAAPAGSGKRMTTRQVLVVAQVLLSTVLLLGAGLLIRNLQETLRLDSGFDEEQLMLASVSIASSVGQAEGGMAVQRQIFEQAREKLASIPGVESATLVQYAPASRMLRRTALELPGREDESLQADYLPVGADFPQTFGVEVKQGRFFDEREHTAGPGGVLVSETFADLYWPGENPIGLTLELPGLRSETSDSTFTVIGVATDIKQESRRADTEPLLWLSTEQVLGSRMMLVGRTLAGPGQRQGEIEKALSTLHPDLAVVELGTYERQIAFDLYEETLFSSVATLFGCFGLLLACGGIYSVVNISVGSRTREFGIRMAIGASAGDNERLMLGEATRLVGLGLSLGLLAALVLGKSLASLIPRVSTLDPWAFLPVIVLLLLAGLTASWLPARRAGRVDPMVTLRTD